MLTSTIGDGRALVIDYDSYILTQLPKERERERETETDREGGRGGDREEGGRENLIGRNSGWCSDSREARLRSSGWPEISAFSIEINAPD